MERGIVRILSQETSRRFIKHCNLFTYHIRSAIDSCLDGSQMQMLAHQRNESVDLVVWLDLAVNKG